jgi:hypothetical protein
MLVRALIVLLSLLNLGVAAWWLAHDPSPAKAAPSVAPGAARLQLLQEAAPPPAPSTRAVAPTAADAVAMPAASDVIVPPALQCFSFGPFASKAAGSAAAAKLRPQVQKLSAREQAASSVAARGWRVYLPPLPSLEQAQTIAQRIGAAGFSDFLVVREGAEANSIALGRYSSEDAAKKRADALAAAGFAAQAEPVGEAAKAVSTVWLDVVADEAFDPRRAQAAIAAAQYRKADCTAR